MFKINSQFLSVLINLKIHRCKHKENHWSVQKKKKSATSRALDHFDEVYCDAFRNKWLSVRKGLMGKSKYVAVLNNYSDVESTIKFLQNKGAFSMQTIFELEKGYLQDENVKSKRQRDLQRIWKTEEECCDTNQIQYTSSHKLSLHHSLNNSQIDSSRLINGNNPTSILHEFVPATKLKGRNDFIVDPEKADINVYKNEPSDEFISITDDIIKFPQHLNVFCFEESNTNDFPSPRRGSTQVLNYYLMDGASVLPVLALDLYPGCRLLDMCAAPGGKSLIALQTLYPDFIRCNDISISRTNRIFSVMKQYLYDFQEKWLETGKILITNSDGRFLEKEEFDRVLVDVPCTTDRHSVKEEENNIFRPDRVKERLQLPELQTELLINALRTVKVGGIVVYSTCSLSPIQNEGVVHMALKKLWEETEIRIQIKDLGMPLLQFRHIFHFSSPRVTKYGHLVIPHVTQNYGPMYFCKLQRIK